MKGGYLLTLSFVTAVFTVPSKSKFLQSFNKQIFVDLTKFCKEKKVWIRKTVGYTYLLILLIWYTGQEQIIVEAYESIATVVETLNSVRFNSEEYTSKWFQEAADIAKEVGVVPQKSRTTGKQIHRENMPA